MLRAERVARQEMAGERQPVAPIRNRCRVAPGKEAGQRQQAVLPFPSRSLSHIPCPGVLPTLRSAGRHQFLVILLRYDNQMSIHTVASDNSLRRHPCILHLSAQIYGGQIFLEVTRIHGVTEAPSAPRPLEAGCPRLRALLRSNGRRVISERKKAVVRSSRHLPILRNEGVSQVSTTYHIVLHLLRTCVLNKIGRLHIKAMTMKRRKRFPRSRLGNGGAIFFNLLPFCANQLPTGSDPVPIALVGCKHQKYRKQTAMTPCRVA